MCLYSASAYSDFKPVTSCQLVLVVHNKVSSDLNNNLADEGSENVPYLREGFFFVLRLWCERMFFSGLSIIVSKVTALMFLYFSHF